MSTSTMSTNTMSTNAMSTDTLPTDSMSAITILAPITLAKGYTEQDLLAASQNFQRDFVANQPV